MSSDFTRHIAQSTLWACRLEVLAPKPGNVHPHASFSDLTCNDFLRSAEAVAPLLAQTPLLGVGRTIHLALAATRESVHTNTNLGILLLLAPMAAVPPELTISRGIPEILRNLNVTDASEVYQAIRLTRPGGLGEAPAQDVRETPTVTLLHAMKLAADRDAIAAQYATDYTLVLDALQTLLPAVHSFPENWKSEIIRLALWLQVRSPDTLIARKCGHPLAVEASRRASGVLELWDNPQRASQLENFDQWLRADGNRRNPGTTADLVAAVLFAAFRDRILPLPDTWNSIPDSQVQP